MYKIDSWKENMFIIFGSSNLAAVIFIPLERRLPLRGLEWSFMDQQDQKAMSGSASKS